MSNDAIPVAPELVTGTPTQQILAATVAIHTWLLPRIDTGNSVPVTQPELSQLRFLMDCIDRATETIRITQEP